MNIKDLEELTIDDDQSMRDQLFERICLVNLKTQYKLKKLNLIDIDHFNMQNTENFNLIKYFQSISTL